jgi:hypothetical protein
LPPNAPYARSREAGVDEAILAEALDYRAMAKPHEDLEVPRV